MDFQKLSTRFRQFGGFRLLGEYAKLGAILPAVKAAWRFTVHGEWFKVGVFQCCKEIYGTVILKKVEPFLERKYSPVVQGARLKVHGEKLEHKKSKVIWFCWLQGLNEAPEIVRVCYHSLMEHLVKDHGYRLEVIDGKNWHQFIELPGYVVRKWEKGRIPAANFSDLLRLELLIKYGGTWIDSTVLCTGGSGLKVQGCPSGESARARDKSNKLGSPLAQSQTSGFFAEQSGRAERKVQDLRNILHHLGLAKFAGAMMYVMKEACGMASEELLCEPDEEAGKFLLVEIMLAGNFGHFDARTVRPENETFWQRNIRKFKRQLRFVKYYPGEVFGAPIWKTWHLAWRMVNR